MPDLQLGKSSDTTVSRHESYTKNWNKLLIVLQYKECTRHHYEIPLDLQVLYKIQLLVKSHTLPSKPSIVVSMIQIRQTLDSVFYLRFLSLTSRC